MKCSFEDGVHVYGDPECTSLLHTVDGQFAASDIVFYPNPFTHDLKIACEKGFEQLTVKLYNPVGQLVREIDNQSGQNVVLNRGNLPVGLYLMQLFEHEKLIKTGHVMVAD